MVSLFYFILSSLSSVLSIYYFSLWLLFFLARVLILFMRHGHESERLPWAAVECLVGLVRDLDIGFDIARVDVSKFNMVYT